MAKGQTKSYENIPSYDGYLAERLLKSGKKTVKELSDWELVAYAYWMKSEADFYYVVCNGTEEDVKKAISLMRESLETGKKFTLCIYEKEGAFRNDKEREECFARSGFMMDLT